MEVKLFIVLVLFVGWTNCLDQNQIASILNDHNTPRSLYCVSPLTWNTSIAAQAQTYSDSCPTTLTSNPSYGQTFAGRGPTATVDQLMAVIANSSGFVCETITDNNYSGFTQVVWAYSRQVGCGFSTCGSLQILLCYYSPPGNVQTLQPFNCPTQCVDTSGASTGSASMMTSGSSVTPVSTSSQPSSMTSSQPSISTSSQVPAGSTSSQPAAGSTSSQVIVGSTTQSSQPDGSTTQSSSQPPVGSTSSQVSVVSTTSQPVAGSTTSQPSVRSTSAAPSMGSTTQSHQPRSTTSQPSASSSSASSSSSGSDLSGNSSSASKLVAVGLSQVFLVYLLL